MKRLEKLAQALALTDEDIEGLDFSFEQVESPGKVEQLSPEEWEKFRKYQENPPQTDEEKREYQELMDRAQKAVASRRKKMSKLKSVIKTLAQGEVINYEKRGPGRFSNTVEEFIHDIVLDGLSDAFVGDENFGFYDLVNLEEPVTVKQGGNTWSFISAIMYIDNNGFVYVDTFDNQDEADAKWALIEQDYEEFLGEVGDEDY